MSKLKTDKAGTKKEEKSGWVYVEIFPACSSFVPYYIGKHWGTLESLTRYLENLGRAHDRKSSHYGRTRAKHSDNWYWLILHSDVPTEDETLELEIDEIDYFESYDYGLNSTLGGEGCSGLHHSLKTKAILAKKCANYGNDNGFFGKTHSIKTKIKMRAAKLGKPSPRKGQCHTEESIAKMSATHKASPSKGFLGYHHTEESNEKNRQAHIGLFAGEKHPMYGKQHSAETKAKISESRKGIELTDEMLMARQRKQADKLSITVTQNLKNRVEDLSRRTTPRAKKSLANMLHLQELVQAQLKSLTKQRALKK